ncbi:uncharacterized protein TNCV_1430261 [Trichonephila clavipes]|nr:uncharacterized protein TNCV_1430261 [Trichonephila clavipes]
MMFRCLFVNAFDFNTTERAPADFSIDVRAHLQATFPGSWIGRGGPIAWPARSPDLSPLDFFLWGFLKGLVYETPVATPEDLVGRIIEAAGCVRDTPGIFEKVRCSMQRRCQACLDASGKNFEFAVSSTLVECERSLTIKLSVMVSFLLFVLCIFLDAL